MKKEKAEIDLYNAEHLGLIIMKKSGVTYTNQTGGYACLHPETEGVYVPLSNEKSELLNKLIEYFTGLKWKGCCWDGIDEETANFIDKLLRETSSIKYSAENLGFISVDREQLKLSHEAWIYVNLSQPSDESSIINGFGDAKGILTWPNSD